MSTIIVNKVFDSTTLSKFIQTIDSPSLIIFDEFEKIYSDGGNYDEEENNQNGLLSLLDGLFTTKKLFVFTCNNIYRVTDMMKNRPGRIYYHLEFKGLSDNAIEEYCQDNLKNKENIPLLLSIKKVIEDLTFDMLQAIVEEMNRYDETPQQVLQWLNIKPQTYDMYFNVNIKSLDNRIVKLKRHYKTIHTNPLQREGQFIYFNRFNKDGEMEDNEYWVELTVGKLTNQNNDTYTYFDEEENVEITLTKKEEENLWRYAF